MLTFLFALIFFEFFLRSTEIMLPSFVYDNKQLGRTHKPDALVNLINAEGFYMGKINQFGYAGIGYPREKSVNEFRIALIGDSYIEGFQLFERNHFKTFLENHLSKILNTKVEVLNFGIGGADLRGMYLRFDKLAKEYNPDITLFFVKEEDLVKKDVLPMPEPYIKNDSIEFSENFLNTADSKIRQEFAFVRDYSVGNLFKEVFEVYHEGLLIRMLFDKLYPVKNLSAQSFNRIYSIDTDKFYEINKKILEILSNKENKNYHPVIVEINQYPEYYNDLIKNLSINVFSLKSELSKYNPTNLTYWKASGKIGHWNQFAHKIVGNYLFNKLKKFIISDSCVCSKKLIIKTSGF